MDIHQVSVNYQQEQDRILVRINTRQDEEIRLWLTRRLCVGWVPAFRDALDRIDLAAAQAGVAPATSTEATQASAPEAASEGQAPDFKTPFKAHAQTLPLGSKPLLVTTVRMSLRPPDKLDIAFEESLSGQSAQARGFQASLEQQLAQGILHLLEQQDVLVFA